MSAEITEKKERKPRASIDEMLSLEITKLQKIFAKKAKAEAKAKGEIVGMAEPEDNTAKKDALKAIDEQIEALKNIKKLIKRI